jgi:N-acetylglucosaminyl-diphospho-decaprenol L-rhamnosyltransferase
VRDTAVGYRPDPVDGLRPAGRLAVVVVNYGSPDLLERNLPGLGPVPVVVVDNHKTDADSAAVARVAARHGWDLRAQPANVGFGAGMNIGAAAAFGLGAEVLLLLNPDAVVTAEVVEQLRLAAMADRDALITPLLLRPDGSVWFRGGLISLPAGGLRRHPGTIPDRHAEWLTGACLALHRDLWNRLGGFDEDYFLYWEDVDLSHRCDRLGGRLVVRSDLTAVHDAGGTQDTSGRRAKSAVYYHYNCRNRLVFAAKHLQRRDQLRWLLRTPAEARRVLLRGGRRQLVHPGRTVWPVVTGSVAGIRWLLRSMGRRRGPR